MAQKGITGAPAEEIVRSITSFALYGFPESHAASFALIAYASAYLKCHHAAAFFAAMLNCYPMGFYHPATLVKDAQRHGVTILPIDVSRSAVALHFGSSRVSPANFVTRILGRSFASSGAERSEGSPRTPDSACSPLPSREGAGG